VRKFANQKLLVNMEREMRDVAKESYDRLEIGATGWMRPDPNQGETVEGFQSVIAAAQHMTAQG
jgi:hypothetical protein